MPIETEVRRPTRFQALVTAATAQLDLILEAEGRAVPTTAFGKVQWIDGMKAPRIHWVHAGGSFTLSKNIVDTGAGESTVPPIGFRVARTVAMIWHISAEHLEHMLDRLWMATSRSAGGEAFRWQTATYEYPTELEGPWLSNGHAVIRLSLPVELAVAGEYDGETSLVTVSGSELRAGIENPIDEDPDDPDAEYDVDRWTG